jgi:zinc-binding alcohol dehydrogenase family protein
MKAVVMTRSFPASDPKALLDTETEAPARPMGRDLLVRVEAVAVNPVDTKVRRNRPQNEISPKILGWDAAGVVEAVGPECSLFTPGDAVYYAGALDRPGCNAQFQLVDERIVGRKPEKLSFAEAAALPLTSLTAWETLLDRLHIGVGLGNSDQTLLVIGGAGGVGSVAIQLARRFGLKVVATASRPESQAWCRSLGAHYVVGRSRPLREEVRAVGVEHVDFIANFADTDAYWAEMAELIKPQGKICSIVENSGPLDLGLLKSKSATFVWEFMFTRSMFRTADIEAQGRILNEVAKLADAGALRTTVGENLGPIRADLLREAHARLEAGTAIGKLVLAGW